MVAKIQDLKTQQYGPETINLFHGLSPDAIFPPPVTFKNSDRGA